MSIHWETMSVQYTGSLRICNRWLKPVIGWRLMIKGGSFSYKIVINMSQDDGIWWMRRSRIEWHTCHKNSTFRIIRFSAPKQTFWLQNIETTFILLFSLRVRFNTWQVKSLHSVSSLCLEENPSNCRIYKCRCREPAYFVQCSFE